MVSGAVQTAKDQWLLVIHWTKVLNLTCMWQTHVSAMLPYTNGNLVGNDRAEDIVSSLVNGQGL